MYGMEMADRGAAWAARPVLSPLVFALRPLSPLSQLSPLTRVFPIRSNCALFTLLFSFLFCLFTSRFILDWDEIGMAARPDALLACLLSRPWPLGYALYHALCHGTHWLISHSSTHSFALITAAIPLCVPAAFSPASYPACLPVSLNLSLSFTACHLLPACHSAQFKV